jgi:hypothetical protein
MTDFSDAAGGDLGLPGASAPHFPGTPAPTLPNHADDARMTLEARKADGEWTKRYLAGGHEERAEFLRLTEQMHAQPAGAINVGGPSLEAQNADQADWLAENIDVSAAVIEQVRSGRPVTADEYRMATARKNALFGDPAWREKYFRGDAEARRQKVLLDVILSSRVAL